MPGEWMAPGQTERRGEMKQSCWKTRTWSDKSLAGGQKRLRGKSANNLVLGPKRLKLEGTFPMIDPLIARSLESSKALCPRPSLTVTSSVISHIHFFRLGNILRLRPTPVSVVTGVCSHDFSSFILSFLMTSSFLLFSLSLLHQMTHLRSYLYSFAYCQTHPLPFAYYRLYCCDLCSPACALIAQSSHQPRPVVYIV